jgi:hypothetical protein
MYLEPDIEDARRLTPSIATKMWLFVRPGA